MTFLVKFVVAVAAHRSPSQPKVAYIVIHPGPSQSNVARCNPFERQQS